jgi:spore coat protein U-like protein
MTRRNVNEDEATEESVESKPVDRTAQAKAAANMVRARAAQVIWVVCVVAAVILASGALCIALKANPDNGLVKFCINTADKLDFGVFSRTDGVAHWKGNSQSALTKNACVNWGLAAVVWLIIGKVAERLLRPRNA